MINPRQDWRGLLFLVSCYRCGEVIATDNEIGSGKGKIDIETDVLLGSLGIGVPKKVTDQD